MTATRFQPAQVGVLVSGSMVRVPRDATLSEVAEALDLNDVGAVVVGLDMVEGIVTERDLVRAIAAHHEPSLLRAEAIATTQLVYCDARASMEDAAELMMEHYVRHLILEDGNTVLGIVSARDLLGAFVAR